MLKVGITGGIGSGKSVVCKIFAALGLPVFYADDIARMLMREDALLRSQLTEAFGEDIYPNGVFYPPALSAKVFNNATALQRLNSIVHPAVRQYSASWIAQQNAPYIIREAAILIESGRYKDVDVVVLVTAPEALRINRVMQRSGLTEKDIRSRMAQQLSDEEKRPYAQYEIINDDVKAVLPQVLQLNAIFGSNS